MTENAIFWVKFKSTLFTFEIMSVKAESWM